MHQAALLLAACSSAKCNLELLLEAIWTRSQPHLCSNVKSFLGLAMHGFLCGLADCVKLTLSVA